MKFCDLKQMEQYLFVVQFVWTAASPLLQNKVCPKVDYKAEVSNKR